MQNPEVSSAIGRGHETRMRSCAITTSFLMDSAISSAVEAVNGGSVLVAGNHRQDGMARTMRAPITSGGGTKSRRTLRYGGRNAENISTTFRRNSANYCANRKSNFVTPKRGRGRPKTGKALSAAERMGRYRARLRNDRP